MAERLVLHPAAHLIELGVGQLDEMKRIGDLGGVGQHRVEHRPIRAGQIERRPLDRVAPRRRRGRRTRRTAQRCHDQGQRRAVDRPDVDDRRRPPLGAPPPEPDEQGLIEPDRRRLADPLRVVIDEGGAVGDHGVVDGVPVTAQLDADLVDRAATAADLLGHPAPSPIRQHQPRRGDRPVLAGPRAHRTRRARAAPAMLAPHQPSPAPERRQIDQLDHVAILDRRRRATARTRRPLTDRLDVHEQRPAGVIDDAEHAHRGQANEQLAHASRVRDPQGLLHSDGVENRQIRRAPVPRPGPSTQLHPAHFRSARILALRGGQIQPDG